MTEIPQVEDFPIGSEVYLKYAPVKRLEQFLHHVGTVTGHSETYVLVAFDDFEFGLFPVELERVT